MTLLTASLCLVASLLPVLLIVRAGSPQERRVLAMFYALLLAGSAILLISQALGLHWPRTLQILAFCLLGVFLLWRFFSASFWAKLVYQGLWVVHLALGGYLYTASQLPYGEAPFADLSQNRPRPLKPDEFPLLQVSGVPGTEGVVRADVSSGAPAHPQPTTAIRSAGALRWSELERFMAMDSQTRRVLQPLKEKQERELSEVLAQLNTASVAGTNMRRRAIGLANVDDLLKERAISEARHRTIVETWALLDHDEQAFRARQADELFNAMLDLLTEEKVDESNKVELIDFMIRRFPHDVRLVKPLIEIYDHLDEEYPRQKRLNRDFLRLYLAKREAVLRGFRSLGSLAQQPLLDYRRKTISRVSYSQARLDAFLRDDFGVPVRPLYGVIEPQTVPDFLNRPKYPGLGKLSGASFKQEYIRRNLRKLAEDNRSPATAGPVMGLPEDVYRTLVESLERRYWDEVDRLTIDPDPRMRANLAWHLAVRKDPYSVPLIFELMRDADPEVRRLAAIAAGNFKIVDAQGSNDPKFVEIVRMLQNYRSNSDAFGRAWALTALTTLGDRQKALYVVDLILNDGATANSVLGEAAPAWRSEEEKEAVKSLVEMLKQTPEELSVKTQALNTLIALDSPETLDILLHYLEHVYEVRHGRPGIWRYLVPHMSLPQEAENIEDVVYYLAAREKERPAALRAQNLKSLHVHLRQAYENFRSGEFFQFLDFLKAFDPAEYASYLEQTREQIRIMRIVEYAQAAFWVWVVFWPLSLIVLLMINYGFPSLAGLAGMDAGGRRPAPNRRSNPASDARQATAAPPAAIVPIKVINHPKG